MLNVETGIARTVTTDERGNYRVDFLPPAKYGISVGLTGFKTTKADVTVHVSEVQRVDLQLAPEGVSETVMVVSEASAAINTFPAGDGFQIRNRQFGDAIYGWLKVSLSS